jgi:hypothetical protein
MTTKGCKKRVSSLEGLLGAILASAEPPMGVRALGIGDSGLEVHSLSMREYAPSVREIFGRGELEELISEARRQVWPHLNQQPLRLGSPREFREAWSPLGIEFRMAKLRSPRGMALLGFYVGKSPVSKRPLICVNTAHHRAAMSGAFAHEMGHHLTARMFGFQQDEEPHHMGYSGYGFHLDDPPELAADIFVSLGIFPQRVARQCFAQTRSESGGNGATSSTGIVGAVAHVANKYGFNGDPSLPQENRVQYLAGVLHYAKLRKALFDEFDL